jgi:6-phosphogluconolactonase
MGNDKKARIISLTLITLLVSIRAQSQHTCVFIGSYNWDKVTEGIYVYELDTVNGTNWSAINQH